MSEFPKELTGNALQQFHEKASRTISEEKIGYYRNMFYSMANFYGIIPVKKAYEIFTDNYGEALSEESFLDLCEFFRYEQKNHFYILEKKNIMKATQLLPPSLRNGFLHMKCLLIMKMHTSSSCY